MEGCDMLKVYPERGSERFKKQREATK